MPDPATQRILVIEDDLKMSRALVAGLTPQGYDIRIAASGEEGFFLIYDFRPHLLLLDLTLPGRGGLEILKQVRDQGHDLRVLVLTSHDAVEDRVAGLKAGADDYLGKPFSFSELIARVEALLRRGQVAAINPSLRVADLAIDRTSRTVHRSGIQLGLTQREFDLLLYLAENRGHAMSREALARDVWHETSRFTPIDNVIDVQMTRLRRKVDDPFPIKLLQTIRGVGFMLREPRQ